MIDKYKKLFEADNGYSLSEFLSRPLSRQTIKPFRKNSNNENSENSEFTIKKFSYQNRKFIEVDVSNESSDYLLYRIIEVRYWNSGDKERDYHNNLSEIKNLSYELDVPVSFLMEELYKKYMI